MNSSIRQGRYVINYHLQGSTSKPEFEVLIFEKEKDFARFVGDVQNFVPGNLGIGYSVTKYSGPTDLTENISAINVMKIKLRINKELGKDSDAIIACIFMTNYHEILHHYGVFKDINYKSPDGRIVTQNLEWLNDGFVEFMTRRVFRQIHGNKYDASLERIDKAGLGSYANYVKIIDALQSVLGIGYIARQFSAAPTKYDTNTFIAQNSLAVKKKLDDILEFSGDHVFELGSEIVRYKHQSATANALTSELVSYLHQLQAHRSNPTVLYPPNQKGRILEAINTLTSNSHLYSSSASALAANVFSYFDLVRYGKTGVTSPPDVICIESKDSEKYRDFVTKYSKSSIDNNAPYNYYRTITSTLDGPIHLDNKGNKIIVLAMNPIPKSDTVFAGTYNKLVLQAAAEMYLDKNSLPNSNPNMADSVKSALILGLIHKAHLALTRDELLALKQFQPYESLFGGETALMQRYFSNNLNVETLFRNAPGMSNLPASLPLYFEELNTYYGILGRYGASMQVVKSDINLGNYIFKDFESDFNRNNYVGTLKLLSYAVPSLPPFYRMALCSNLLTLLKTNDSLKAPNVAQACMSLSSAHGHHSPLGPSINSLFFLERESSAAANMSMEIHRRVQLNIIKYGSSSHKIFEGIETHGEVQGAVKPFESNSLKDKAYINDVLKDISLAIGNRNTNSHVPSISDNIQMDSFEPDNPDLYYNTNFYWNKQNLYSRGTFDAVEYARISGTLDRTLYEFAFACSFIPHKYEAGNIILKSIKDGVVSHRKIAAPDLSKAFLETTTRAQLESIKKSFIADISSKSINFQAGDMLFGAGNFKLGAVSGIIKAMKDSKTAKTDFLKHANMTTECCLGTNHFATYL